MISNQSELALEQAIEAITSRAARLLQTQKRVLIAIDGQSASGKSTAAKLLAERLDAAVFHMDDFFLQPHMRTPERLATPGGNVDVERFIRDVLPHLLAGETVSLERYDCHLDELLPPVELAPRPVSIIEGAYSLHPLLKPHYDIRVFCKIAPALQRARILARNGEEMLQLFESRWIPLEHKYFTAFDVEQSCDFVVAAE
ncbi:MAG TPA: uridine kinase [Feifaniaceae bacterium]|nr:uridine kinase [Feifaniaceae bacterium]